MSGSITDWYTLSLSERIDVLVQAAEEIWRSMQWYGRPDVRGLHHRMCKCADCT